MNIFPLLESSIFNFINYETNVLQISEPPNILIIIFKNNLKYILKHLFLLSFGNLNFFTIFTT